MDEMDLIRQKATYQCCEEVHGNGMFFYTDCCGNRMYSVSSDEMKYHGCLCPRCFWKGIYTTLYLRGTPEATEVMNERQKKVMDKYGISD